MHTRSRKVAAALAATAVGVSLIGTASSSSAETTYQAAAAKRLTIVTPKQLGVSGKWQRTRGECLGVSRCITGFFRRNSPSGQYIFQAAQFVNTAQARQYVRDATVDAPVRKRANRQGVELSYYSFRPKAEAVVRLGVGRFRSRVILILLVAAPRNPQIVPPSTNALFNAIVGKARPSGGQIPVGHAT